MFILENTHTRTILWTRQVIFRNSYDYTNTYMFALTITEKNHHRFEGQYGEYVGQLIGSHCDVISQK